MALLGINTGSTANDGTGDPIRVAMGKINSNFKEIYNTIGNGTSLSSYVYSAGISTLAENLVGSPIINVSGIFNPGITTTEHIEVRNITSIGIITAVQFIGDGSQLSNVTATFPGIDVLDDDVRRGVARELNFGDRIVTTGPNAVGRVTISVDNSLALYSNISGISSRSLKSDYSSSSGYATTSGVSSSLFNSGQFLNIGVGTASYRFTNNNILSKSIYGGEFVISSSDPDITGNPITSRIILTDDANEDLVIQKVDGPINILITNSLNGEITEWLFRQDGTVVFPDGTQQLSGFDGYADRAGISSTSEDLVNGTNINAGIVTAATFFGDGSGLTGIVATGSGVEIKDDGTLVGTATTINFGQKLEVSVGSGIATISGSDSVSYSEVSGISTTSEVSQVSQGLTGSPNIIVGVVTSSLLVPSRVYSKVQTINNNTGFIDLRGQNAITGRMVLINPTSGDTIVVFPEATSDNAGWELIVKNKSDNFQLSVRESNDVDLISTLSPLETVIFFCDGTEWSTI